MSILNTYGNGGGEFKEQPVQDQDAKDPKATGSGSPKNIKSLQTFLKSEGLYEGEVDGIWGPKSNAALTEYQSQTEGMFGKQMSKGTLPVNVRALANDLTGRDKPITAGSLKDKEMEALRKVVRQNLAKGKSRIEYGDYQTTQGKRSPYADVGGGAGTIEIAKKAATDPNWQMKTALGQAQIITTPTDTLVMDQYNFNNAKDSDWESYVADVKENPSLYNLFRSMGKNFGSKEGEGANVLINTSQTHQTDLFKNGGKNLYNSKRAKEIGYKPDETGHMPSVDDQTGMWLKSMDHPTAWKEYLHYSLNPDLNKKITPVLNPAGYFGDRQLQYVPKEKFANGGKKNKNPYGEIDFSTQPAQQDRIPIVDNMEGRAPERIVSEQEQFQQQIAQQQAKNAGYKIYQKEEPSILDRVYAVGKYPLTALREGTTEPGYLKHTDKNPIDQAISTFNPFSYLEWGESLGESAKRVGSGEAGWSDALNIASAIPALRPFRRGPSRNIPPELRTAANRVDDFDIPVGGRGPGMPSDVIDFRTVAQQSVPQTNIDESLINEFLAQSEGRKNFANRWRTFTQSRRDAINASRQGRGESPFNQYGITDVELQSIQSGSPQFVEGRAARRSSQEAADRARQEASEAAIGREQQALEAEFQARRNKEAEKLKQLEDSFRDEDQMRAMFNKSNVVKHGGLNDATDDPNLVFLIDGNFKKRGAALDFEYSPNKGPDKSGIISSINMFSQGRENAVELKHHLESQLKQFPSAKDRGAIGKGTRILERSMSPDSWELKNSFAFKRERNKKVLESLPDFLKGQPKYKVRWLKDFDKWGIDPEKVGYNKLNTIHPYNRAQLTPLRKALGFIEENGSFSRNPDMRNLKEAKRIMDERIAEVAAKTGENIPSTKIINDELWFPQMEVEKLYKRGGKHGSKSILNCM